MTTLTIKGDSEVINQILELIKEVKDKVTLSKSEAKEPILKSLDEVRTEVKDTLEQIENGTMELYTSKQYSLLMDDFFQGLERDYKN